MESSTVLAFRIFVMLSCLIIVPLAAIFGSAFPDVVKTVLVDRIVAWGTGKPIEANQATPGPDGFREVAPPGGAVAANNHPAGSEAPRWINRDTASWQAPGPSQPPASVVPVGEAGPGDGFNQSASFFVPSDPPTAYPPLQRLVPPPGDSPAAQPANLQQQWNQAADEAPSPYHPAPPANLAARRLGEPERFTEMERKLREYGATYYLLETWGNDGQLFRFHCRMAVGNTPNLTRHFEATDRDALEAMSQVLARVEAWRAGRLQ